MNANLIKVLFMIGWDTLFDICMAQCGPGNGKWGLELSRIWSKIYSCYNAFKSSYWLDKWKEHATKFDDFHF